MESKKEEFLIKFIESFFEKGKTRRRSDRNSSQTITYVINQICRKYFNDSLKFSQEEIIDAFITQQFRIMENDGRGITEKGKSIPNLGFVSISTRVITEFRNFSQDTELKLFWNQNKNLINSDQLYF